MRCASLAITRFQTGMLAALGQHFRQPAGMLTSTPRLVSPLNALPQPPLRQLRTLACWQPPRGLAVSPATASTWLRSGMLAQLELCRGIRGGTNTKKKKKLKKKLKRTQYRAEAAAVAAAEREVHIS